MRDRRFHELSFVWAALALAACIAFVPACKKKREIKKGQAQTGAQEAPKAAEEKLTVPESAVAAVGDLYILRDELNLEVSRLAGGKTLPREQRVKLEERALTGLVNIHLIRMAAEADELEATDDEVETELEIVTARQGGDEGFAAFLQSQHLDEEQYREHLSINVLRRKLREGRFPEPVTEEQMRAYYEQYAKSPNRDMKVKVARIFIGVGEEDEEGQWTKAEEKLAGIRAEILGGLDFAEAAKKYSTDNYARRGGVMGWATRHRRPEDVFAPGFELDEGEISPPVRVSDGVELLQVIKRKDDGVGTFKQERERVREILDHQKMERDDTRLFDRLRREFKVESYL